MRATLRSQMVLVLEPLLVAVSFRTSVLMLRRRQAAQAAAEATARAQRAADTRCGLCERAVQHTSRHHLVPREEGGRYGDTVDLCQPCHSSVHRFLTNRELARQYATVEALRAAQELQGYLDWIRKSRVEKISNRRGK
jgi:5-methylcytosine-specific restriction protein A